MNKIIIQNDCDLPMAEVLELAQRVVQEGYQSGQGEKAQYCYITTWKYWKNNQKKRCICYASKNKHSDKLTFTETPL